MTRNSATSRRKFLKGGALLAAPIAGASVSAAALADEELKTRLERLEDEAAIHELHRSWLRRVNSGERDTRLDDSVRRITADHAGETERVELAADGLSAVGRYDYAVEAETPLAADCTLAQMAHAQGHGAVRRTERRKLTVDYAKIEGRWSIAKVALTA